MNTKALEILKELRININPGFIMFDPNSTFDELKQNVQFIRETGLQCRKGTSSSLFNRMIICPGSEAERDFLRIRRLTTMSNNGKEDNAATTIGYRYEIADSKVNAAEKVITFHQSEIGRKHAAYKRMRFDKLRVAKWEQDIPSLNLTILEKTVHFLEAVDAVSEQEVEALKTMVHRAVDQYCQSYFGFPSHYTTKVQEDVER